MIKRVIEEEASVVEMRVDETNCDRNRCRHFYIFFFHVPTTSLCLCEAFF